MSLATHKPYVYKDQPKAGPSPNSIALKGPSSNYKGQSYGSQNARSTSVDRSQQSIKKSYIGSPPKASDSSHAKYAENFSGYKDAPVRWDEGVYRRLYEHPVKAGYVSQYQDRSRMVDPKAMMRDYSMPSFSRTEGALTKNFQYNDFQQQPLFPNTPFKQDLPQTQYFQGLREPINSHYTPKALLEPSRRTPPYDSRNRIPTPGAQSGPIQVRQEFVQTTQVNPSSRTIQDIKNKYLLPKPTISPTYKSSIFDSAPRIPTLQDTAKMRNPMFANFDYSRYNPKSISSREPIRTQATGNYTSVEPVSTKEFLKSHASSIAQARNYDMEQRTKIHPQLGLIAKSDTETKEPILKPFADEANRSLNSLPSYARLDSRPQQISTTNYASPPRDNLPMSTRTEGAGYEYQRAIYSDKIRYTDNKVPTRSIFNPGYDNRQAANMLSSPEAQRRVLGDYRYGQYSNAVPSGNYPW